MRTVVLILYNALIAGLVVLLHLGFFWYLTTLQQPPLSPLEKPKPVQVNILNLPPTPIAEKTQTAAMAPKPKPKPAPKPKPEPKPKSEPKSQPAPKPVAEPPPAPAPVVPPVTETAAAPGHSTPETNPIRTAQAKLPASTPAPAKNVETVTPPMFNVSYLHNPPPAYPRLAKRRGEQGTVLLSVHVSAQGQAQTIQLKRSSGSPRLDSAAETAVRNWRFVPAKRGDTAIAEWVIVPIQFTLE